MSAVDEAESGYWDLVYLLYPEMAEAAGMGVLHELVSSWPLLERTLAVQHTAPLSLPALAYIKPL